MATKAQKVRLSIFLITAGSLLAITIVALVGGRLLRRADVYEIDYRDMSVSGLEAGAPVKYHGVQVGHVADLFVKDPSTVGVRIEVRRGTPIQRDTEAVLAHMGITGQKFVELVGGSEAAGTLEPGGTIPAGRSMFDSISDRAEAILDKTEILLDGMNQLLDAETTGSIQRLLEASAGVAEHTEELLADDRFGAALNHLAAASARMDSVAGRIGTQVDSMRMAETMATVREFFTNSNEMVVHSDLLLMQARADVLRSLGSMEEALDNLREATEIIRDNPAVLIRGRQDTGIDRMPEDGR